jgi:hypothetical protein
MENDCYVFPLYHMHDRAVKEKPYSLTPPGFTALQIQKAVQMMRERRGLILVCGQTLNKKWAATVALLLQEEHMGKEKRRPEVITAGEIRDKRSARIAVQVSLTGHLVLSTLRTDDTADAFMRMVDFGIEPLVLASVLKGIIVQKIIWKGRKKILLADVASVSEELKNVVVRQYTADELNNSFLHCSNVMSEILKSIKCLQPPAYINHGESAEKNLFCKRCGSETEKQMNGEKTEKDRVRKSTGCIVRSFLIADNLLRLKRKCLRFKQNRYSVRSVENSPDQRFNIRYQTIPGELMK